MGEADDHQEGYGPERMQDLYYNPVAQACYALQDAPFGETFSYEYDIPEEREDYLEEGDSGVAEEGQCDEDFPYEDGHDEYGEYV